MNSASITFDPAPSQPALVLPEGATDTHCHVFGPTDRFAFAEGAKFRPGDAPKETLFALHDRIGIDRCVVVQSGCHGFDNSVTLDAMLARPGRYLGVALLPRDVSDAELQRHAGLGFRAVRFNYMAHLAAELPIGEIPAFASRLAGFGLHLQLHMESGLIAEMAPAIASSPVPVVIDHMGRIDASEGRDQKAFAALMKLLEHDHVWVKVSGCERASRQDAPYADAVPFAARLVETYPDRVLWGTDWPHPNFRVDTPPDDGVLVDLLSGIAPTPALLQALLVDNPMRLYRFEA
ncbi:amidohydrolase family protein [Jiella mangrovi]|uniref:Amidohydrolase family protein n=1 Tax=Jiella mangrovi TaxID=2821407 RepID=A0ABS4BJD0_9HYPH|nr:amidohydrolase family protein [Jiella mangrovi]MBP0616884.1 amidohydrolase family protein [Jiella mangrovi]